MKRKGGCNQKEIELGGGRYIGANCETRERSVAKLGV